ncbi:MAG: efflux RND transporter periplasmic adaptor subunit [Polyangiaceae bacterium]|nr:efflux RND transporter periplasmic adaptor subunit [Polyangiaceae bacterium]
MTNPQNRSIGARLGRALVAVGLVGLTVGGVMLIKPWQASSSTAATATAAPKSGPQEIGADALKLKGRSADTTVTAVGTLLANESVSIASEVSRRVTKIRFEDGASVKKGDVLFELDAADLRARASELSVRRKLLALTEQRQKKLAAEGLAPQSEYDRAKSELDLLDAESGTLYVDIAKATIKAPFDGKLGLRNVSVGAMVSAGSPLVTLQDTSRLKVDFTIPERYAAAAKEGARFSFHIEGSATKFEGTVLATEPVVDEGTRSLKLRGLSDPTTEKLVPGGFVSVELALTTQGGALFVPTEAVIPSLGGHAVYRVEDGAAKLVEVQLGLRTDREVQVTKGLAEGDTVLTSNLLRLRPGAKVKLAKVDE